jgi:hypothetical protein
MDYVEGDDDISGDEAANVLGAVARSLVRGSGGRKIFKRPPLSASAIAQPNDAMLRAPMGFGAVTWAVADGAAKTSIVEPQEAFRGERLVIDVSIPTTITNLPIVLLRRADIGTQPQTPSTEFGSPAAMFRPDCTYSQLEWQVCPAGTKIQLTMEISAAPTGAGIITAAMGVYGQWIR